MRIKERLGLLTLVCYYIDGVVSQFGEVEKDGVCNNSTKLHDYVFPIELI
jgi:hypothetical protein